MYYQLAKHRVMETERLILRPITLDDADDLFEYASDIDNTRHVFPTHQSIDETNWVISNLFMKNPLGHFAIELKESGKMIGTCDIRPNEAAQSVELAYAINKRYWGQGLAPEAAKKLLDFSIEHLKARRIWAAHDYENHASGRVMEKIGMTHEGVIRMRKNLCGELRDAVIHSYIVSEH